jgi:heterodisulfide reductase subunit B
MDVSYFPGCTLHASSELYDLQCKAVLSRLGITLRELDDWNCCGASSAAKTDDFLAVALPARNLGIADAAGLGEVVIPCAACYSRTMIARQTLAADPRLTATINAELKAKITGGTKVSSIVEPLVEKTRSGELGAKVVRTLTGLTAACYYGCLMTRFPFDIPIPDSVENPQGMETVLEPLGVETVDWSYKTDCCGASAALNDPEQSFLLMSRILKDAIARGANCLVATCPMCQFNLDAYQTQVGQAHGIRERLPVYLLTELVGLSLGMTPGELQLDRHLEESIELLKKLRLT